MDEYKNEKTGCHVFRGFALGIGACFHLLYGSIPIGALGIIMALFFPKEKMSPQARAGLILSIVGMAIFTCIIAVIITILTVSGGGAPCPENRNR